MVTGNPSGGQGGEADSNSALARNGSDGGGALHGVADEAKVVGCLVFELYEIRTNAGVRCDSHENSIRRRFVE